MTAKSKKGRRSRNRVPYIVSTPGVPPDDIIEKISQAHAKAILASGTYVGDPGQPEVKSGHQGAPASGDEMGEQRVEQI